MTEILHILSVHNGTCSICYKKGGNDLVQCPHCKTISHKDCLDKWAKESNVGIEIIFSCHFCYNIISDCKLSQKTKKIIILFFKD